MEANYKSILRAALIAPLRPTRTGVSARSIFKQDLSYRLDEGFPLTTSKFVSKHIMETEFAWLISGKTNIKPLIDAGVTIWNEWADENGDLGPVYGHQLRNFNSQGFDQLNEVIETLKADPYGRRHIISLWNPPQLKEMRLPPCYLYFQFYVNHLNELDLFVVQRSADLFLGVPYDLGLFSLLQLYVGGQAGYKPGLQSITFVDAHIYENHTEQVKKYLDNPMYDLPQYQYNIEEPTKIQLSNYKHAGVIKAPVAV